MSYTDLSICSKALLRLGASNITSFLEGTAEAEVASGLYPLVRDSLLSAYPWSFALGQKRLPRLAAAPLADYRHAYQLPPDFLRVVSAGIGLRGRGMSYRIAENALHTNMPEVNLTYIARIKESSFPAFFVEALIAKLGAEMCVPLTENAARADQLLRQADDIISRARLVDSQQDTPKAFEDFVLVGART